MKVGLFDLLVILIIFQNLIFTAFLIVRKAKHISNYLLGIQLFSQAAGIFSGYCWRKFDFFSGNFVDMFYVFYPFIFLWGPTFYFYVKSIAYNDFKFKWLHLFHFAPFLLVYLFLLFTFFPLGYNEKVTLLKNYSYFIIRYRYYFDIFIRAQVLFYILLSIRIYFNVNRRIQENYSTTSKSHISWLKFIVSGFTSCYIISGLFVIYNIIDRNYVSTMPLLVTLPYFIFFNIIFFKAWYHPGLFSGVEEVIKYKASKLTKDEAVEWIKKLNEFVINKRPYLNPDLTLNQLAEDININPRILSQVINEYFNQNFHDYINKLRIEESKKILSELGNKKTILEILYDVGFNTKSAYNIAFKKATGVTPTEYKRNLKQQLSAKY